MPYCTQCGYEVKPDANFCARCGTKLHPSAGNETVPPKTEVVRAQVTEEEYLGGASDLFRDYYGKLRKRFSPEPEYSTLLGAFCARDAHVNAVSALSLTKYYYHFYIRYDASAGAEEFLAFTADCLEDVWKLPHHGGLALNTLAIPLLCQDRLNADVQRAMSAPIQKKTDFSFACAAYPVILELESGQMYYPDTPFFGWAVYRSLKKTAGDILYYRR